MKDKVDSNIPSLNLAGDEPMTASRKLVTRIISGGYAFAHASGKRAGYVVVDRSLLDEFNQEQVGNMRVIDSPGDKAVIIGSSDHPEVLQFEILK